MGGGLTWSLPMSFSLCFIPHFHPEAGRLRGQCSGQRWPAVSARRLPVIFLVVWLNAAFSFPSDEPALLSLCCGKFLWALDLGTAENRAAFLCLVLIGKRPFSWVHSNLSWHLLNGLWVWAETGFYNSGGKLHSKPSESNSESLVHGCWPVIYQAAFDWWFRCWLKGEWTRIFQTWEMHDLREPILEDEWWK